MNSSRKSKRHTLAETLMRDLADKGFAAGSRIPSVRKLASSWKVSPLTVTRLLNDLVDAGKLSRKANCGYFLAHDFPPEPRIGYLGSLPLTAGGVKEYLHDEALRVIFNAFDRHKVVPEIFSYADFAKRKHPPEKLDSLNGMLIEGTFLDEHTAGKFRDFSAPVVIFDNLSDGKAPSYLCSQVVVDYRKALKTFFDLYKVQRDCKYVIVLGAHGNARIVADLLKSHLAERGIDDVEEIVLKSGIFAEMDAYSYFRENQRNWRNSFIFSLSGYYSRGIWSALGKTENMPDVLSFDNLERHVKLHGCDEEYFTAIERNMPKAYQRAVELLVEQITTCADETQIVRINAELVIRKSIKSLKNMMPEKGV